MGDGSDGWMMKVQRNNLDTSIPKNFALYASYSMYTSYYSTTGGR